jgi:predicted nucleic acid-binding protein
VAQAVRRAGRRGLLDDRQVTEALDVVLDAPVQRVPSRLLVRRTRTWWPHATVYDALYLGVAAAQGARVLTCDGPLSRAQALGVPVENVRVT